MEPQEGLKLGTPTVDGTAGESVKLGAPPVDGTTGGSVKLGAPPVMGTAVGHSADALSLMLKCRLSARTRHLCLLLDRICSCPREKSIYWPAASVDCRNVF